METVEIIHVCRTCLGPLDEAPRDLFQANFTEVLDVLRGFIADLANYHSDDVFNICSLCYEKLDYISKFKEQCQKSFHDYMELKNKKEDPVISNLGQIFDDDYLSAKIDLDSENLEETITIYKNSDETNSNDLSAIEPKIETPVSSSRRGSRAKQYPTQDVLIAIDEASFYQTDIKNRKCIHCDYMAKINRQLCIHMKCKHADENRMWCSRCNMQTIDLEEHIKAVQCHDYVCKFCNKKCRRLFMLMAHLKSHAFEHFAVQLRKTKSTSQPELSETKLPQLIKDDIPQEMSLQPLSNVVFQYDNTVNTKIAPSVVETVPNIPTSDFKSKASRISKQYDSALVLQAVAACTNYIRDMKNRTCGHCSVVTTLAPGLNNHMLRTHSDVYPFWCNRCNVVTENLQVHKNLVKCNTYPCKFCEKQFDKLNKLTKHLQCHCREIFRNKPTVEEEPAVQLQTSTSVSNDHQQSGDGMPLPIVETTDGNLTYENSQEFFFTEVNTAVNITYENNPLQNHKNLPENSDVKMDEHFENTDGTMTYESVRNTDGNLTYDSGENTDGNMTYEIKQIPRESTEMITESTDNDNIEQINEESNNQDTTLSIDDSDSDEYSDEAPDESDDSEDGPSWVLLEQIDPDEILKALTSVRKPVLLHSKCNICKSALTDNRGLSLHMTVVHKEEKEKWCRICNDLFDDIDEHKEIHAPKCEYCNKTFIVASHLRAHLKNHARNHNFNTSSWLTCKTCSSMFPDEDSLNSHECTPDPSQVDHKSIYQLNLHLRKEAGELTYQCASCEKSFAAKHLLDIHEKQHNLEKQNICNVCSRAFATNAQLELHSLTHTGKPIKCNQCDKSFRFKAELTSHMRLHSGEKPYLCPDCGRGFHNKTALASHSRHTHAGDRPHKCTVCDSSFKVKATLKTHELIHTGLKPFKCTECPYSCRQSYRLTIHMKQHQDEHKSAHVCVFCQERFTTHLLLISHTYASHGEMSIDQQLPTTTTTLATAPNVVNITSHHIIIPDGTNAQAQAIQVAGLDLIGGGGQVVNMDASSGDMTGVQVGGDSNVLMDEMDNVPIQIVYKSVELG